MSKRTPNLGISKPKADPATLRNTLREAAVPATHADAPPAPTADVTRRDAQLTPEQAKESATDDALVGCVLIAAGCSAEVSDIFGHDGSARGGG